MTAISVRKLFRLALLGPAVACLVAAPAVAQQRYTNKDLGKLHVPGAYTNADLKALPPLAMQKAPIVTHGKADLSRWTEETALREARRRALTYSRDRLQAELDYLLERIEIAYSSGGGFTGELRPGLRSKLTHEIEYLRRQIRLLNWDIARLTR